MNEISDMLQRWFDTKSLYADLELSIIPRIWGVVGPIIKDQMHHLENERRNETNWG